MINAGFECARLLPTGSTQTPCPLLVDIASGLDIRRQLPAAPLLHARSRLQNATFRPCTFRSAASNASCVGNVP